MKTNQNHAMKFECPACKAQVAAAELADWPFCCKRCLGKNFTALCRLQAESIARWEATCIPKRSEPARRRWSESIEAGFRKLGI